MEETQIQEGNRIIATKLMGFIQDATVDTESYYHPIDGYYTHTPILKDHFNDDGTDWHCEKSMRAAVWANKYHPKYMEWHSNWDWIMHAIQEISEYEDKALYLIDLSKEQTFKNIVSWVRRFKK